MEVGKAFKLMVVMADWSWLVHLAHCCAMSAPRS